MAVVMSFKERAAKLRACAGILQDAITLNKSVESYRDSLINPNIEEGYGNIYTFITSLLDQIATMIDTVRDELLDFDDAADQGLNYECTVRPYVNSSFSRWNVDVNNGSSRGKITSTNSGGSAAGAPFTGYRIGDTVELTLFENEDVSGVTADGSYTVYSIDGYTDNISLDAAEPTAKQEIVFTTVLTGADKLDDTTGTIRITNR